jgi:hypothetical protein
MGRNRLFEEQARECKEAVEGRTQQASRGASEIETATYFSRPAPIPIRVLPHGGHVRTSSISLPRLDGAALETDA